MVKPSLKLTALEKTAINTSTLESYKEILRIFDCGGWFNYSSLEEAGPSDEYYRFPEHGYSMCVEAGKLYDNSNGVIHISSSNFYHQIGYKIIPHWEFYRIQNIPNTKIKEINDFFDKEEGTKSVKKEVKKESDTKTAETNFIDPWKIDIPKVGGKDGKRI
jgi:hypothetical protein